MEKKIKAYIKEHRMLEKGDKAIVGISGGADSVCLLFVLGKLREELGFELTAVHIHHGLRGEEADKDENYVRALCKRLGVELACFHEQADIYARERGLSVEEAGREIRRRRFLQVLKEQKGTRIALAHHLNDNAETVLFHLCRGTGLRGASGIAPVSGVWIHPLLCVGRKDIETYLAQQNVKWCIDRTNLENAYTRNRLRNDVLPCLEEYVNPQAAAHLHAFAGQARALWGYLEGEIQGYLGRCTAQRESGWGETGFFLEKDAFYQVPEALRPYVMFEWLARAAGKRKDLSQVHVKMLLDLLEKQTGRTCTLPYGMAAVKEYEGLFLGKKAGARPPGMAGPDKGCRMRIFEKMGKIQAFPENYYTKWFDYDIIKNTVEIRHRQPGDFIVIDREGRRQKLKQYFINQKIPRSERNRIWLAADGGQIMWVVGYRQSQAYQVTERTKTILEIEFTTDGKGKGHGRESKGVDI